MNKTKAQSTLRPHQSRVERCAQHSKVVDFFNVLTGPQLLELTESYMPSHRQRLYPPTVTLSMFIKQSLDEDGSCQKAVNTWAAQRVAQGLSAQRIDTGAYCRARQRLPVTMLKALMRETGQRRCTQSDRDWRWQGRTVKLIDGTGVSMPDPAENQARYPQPSTQTPGVGFALARLVGIICLSTGAVIDAAMGPFEGKGNRELGLIRPWLNAFHAAEVALGDALYCNDWLIAMLPSAGVDVVFEQHGSRITDFRRGQRLGPGDHLVSWRKPRQRPSWMGREPYEAFAEVLKVREVKGNKRVLVTTMLVPSEVSKKELVSLYGERRHVELDLRNIKTTLGMEVLRCRTPELVEKELWGNVLAYNLIRLLMVQAAVEAGLPPREISFKHTVQLW